MIYAVDMWNAHGTAPANMWEVVSRQKDMQYASRSTSQIERQKQLHRLRHVIRQLGDRLDEEQRRDPEIRKLLAYGCTTTMHMIPLLAPRLPYEDQSKDMDFSASGIAQRWEAGYAHTMRALDARSWRTPASDLEGFRIHADLASTTAP